MAKIKEAIKDPNYEAAASARSRATIFIFVGTFLYMLVVTDISTGFIGGAIFFFVGIFIVSLLISMPLMMASVKFPKLSSVISIADILITIFATRWVYIWLFAT